MCASILINMRKFKRGNGVLWDYILFSEVSGTNIHLVRVILYLSGENRFGLQQCSPLNLFYNKGYKFPFLTNFTSCNFKVSSC